MFRGIGAAIVVRNESKKGGPGAGNSPLTGAVPEVNQWWDALSVMFSEVFLIAPTLAEHLDWQGFMVRTGAHGREELATVRTGLTVALHPRLMIIDPALPYFSPVNIDRMAATSEPRWDVLALGPCKEHPRIPLVFHQRCLRVVERLLSQTNHGIEDLFSQVRTHDIDIDQLTF